MTNLEEIVKEQKAINCKTVCGVDVLQAWYGGTTVNVYVRGTDGWSEVTCWNVSDEEGRAVEKEEIEKHMAMQAANWEEEGGWFL